MFRFEHMPEPWKYKNNDLDVLDFRLTQSLYPKYYKHLKKGAHQSYLGR